MKRFTYFLLLTVLTSAAFTQELKLSGEAKSGIYWEQWQVESQDMEAEVKLHNKDDAGGGQGRFRLNLDYDNGNGFGFKTRFDWENWVEKYPSNWTYAFGYGNFFDKQAVVSVGKLGASPWGTGGPEMWKNLEDGTYGGMRVEFIPEAVPGLNVGFVLNYYDSDRDQGWDDAEPVTILNLLQESVIGVSYTHDLFHIRVAYRMDGSMDSIQSNKQNGGLGEDSLVYRVEERILQKYLPGLQIWALGHLFGLSAKVDEIKWYRNWGFIQYAPDLFTAQIRVGYEYIDSRSDFLVKPSFYFNLFDKMLNVGAAFAFDQDFGVGKLYPGSPYRFIEVEPKIQFNFTSSYVAFAYNFRQEYVSTTGLSLKPGKEPIKQTQWMNLRFCIYF
jgi:hypothetical protein